MDVMASKETSAGELRQAAEYARAFADLVRSPETKYGFEQLGVRWDRRAERLEAVARLKALKDKC
jgi:hypothetical protein